MHVQVKSRDFHIWVRKKINIIGWKDQLRLIYRYKNLIFLNFNIGTNPKKYVKSLLFMKRKTAKTYILYTVSGIINLTTFYTQCTIQRLLLDHYCCIVENYVKK